ncbi:MAG: hypothetical protein QOH91_324 [Mycobacterium sp.]|jgi:hypothetical protein|nr:hypothetical protein [Mycobacterium sp.]
MVAKRTAALKGMAAAGRRLWDSVNAVYVLDEHESALLREACRTVDLLDDLQKLIDKQGLTDGSFEGKGMNPALRELRAQRLVLSRLMRDLKLPVGVEPSVRAVLPARRTRFENTQLKEA